MNKTPLMDPFAADADATREDFTVTSGPRRAEVPCGIGSKPKRKKLDLNPVERRYLQAQGYTFCRVEHKSAWTGRVHDLWGADFLAIREPGEFLLVQVTTHSEASKRVRKLQDIPEVAVWLACGGRVEVHGWRQPCGPGTAWVNTVREVTVAAEPPGEGRSG